MNRHLILVGMSVSDVHRRQLLLEWLRTGGPSWPGTVSLAFLQLGEPTVSSELTRAVDTEAGEIVLVGASPGLGGPGVSWLRRVAAHWWRGRPDAPLVRVGTKLLTCPDELAGLVEDARPLSGNEARLNSPAWERVPDHRHQVFVCRGPRCTAVGAEQVHAGLVLRLTEAGLGDDDVLLTQTGCQFPCNQAPVVSVQPDDVWYGGVDAAVADRIVAEHLIGGEPVVDHRLPRRG